MALKKFFWILCLLAFIVLPTNRLEAVPSVAVLPFDNKSARQTTVGSNQKVCRRRNMRSA